MRLYRKLCVLLLQLMHGRGAASIKQAPCIVVLILSCSA